MIVTYKDFFGKEQQIEVTGILENIIQQYQYELSKLEQENKKLKSENGAMKIQVMEAREDRDELTEENKNLKEKLSEVTMVSDDEKQSIEHILELEKENKRLKKENFVMKDRLKFGYKGVTREEIDKAEKEKRKLENRILKLGTRIYQNIDGEKRKEYQEYCKRHRL